jgi:CRP-like cAMP-binding protein
MTTSQSLLVTLHLPRHSVAILWKPACIWRSDERDRNTGALHLRRSVFAVLPEPELHRLAGEVHESRLLAGHLLYDPEVTVIASGLVRAFIGDDTGRQVTVAYLRAGATLALAHLAGRRYPTAFQTVEDSRLVVVGDDRARRLHETHPALGWATIREPSARLDDLETGLAHFAFGQLRQRLAYHLLALTAEQDGTPRPVHLAHLATAVGSSREMVSRTLAPLGADGTLRTDPTGVTVTDRQRLRDHANID